MSGPASRPPGAGGEVTRSAPAKVNLFLAVGARRTDGYHDLVTVFEAVPLTDLVTVRLRPAGTGEPTVRVSAFWSPGAPAASHPGAPALPQDLDNLAGRAAQAFIEAVGGRGSGLPPVAIEVTIEKRIPAGAGLGGGSSDAAATLLALQELCGRPLDGRTLRRVAASLGSDVPFFLSGGRAVGRSRGELLTLLPRAPRLHLVLALPPVTLATAEVYRRFDELSGAGPDPATLATRIGPGLPAGGDSPAPAGPRERETALEAFLRALAGGEAGAVARCLRNDLQAAALSLRPEVGEMLRALVQAGCLGALVSGSGASVFGLAAGEEEAAGAAARASSALPPALVGRVAFVPVVSPAWEVRDDPAEGARSGSGEAPHTLKPG